MTINDLHDEVLSCRISVIGRFIILLMPAFVTCQNKARRHYLASELFIRRASGVSLINSTSLTTGAPFSIHTHTHLPPPPPSRLIYVMKFEIILSCETEDGVIVSLNETLSQAQFFELLNGELLGESESASKVRKCIYAMVDTRKRAELIAQVHLSKASAPFMYV